MNFSHVLKLKYIVAIQTNERTVTKCMQKLRYWPFGKSDKLKSLNVRKMGDFTLSSLLVQDHLGF